MLNWKKQKMFKNVDLALYDLGFNKQIDLSNNVRNKVVYMREMGGWIHGVTLFRRKNKESYLHSYVVKSNDNDELPELTNVGLTYQELKLFIKKMKQLKMN